MLRPILTRAASAIDSAVNSAALSAARRGRNKGPESLSHEERMRALEHVRDVYDKSQHFADASSLFPAPVAPYPDFARVRAIPEGDVLDATWRSDFTPYCADVTDRYMRYEKNRTAAARLFLHADRARPAAILIHGYSAGQFALEERVWPTRWLFERGLDVALVVLPFHAVRAEGRGAARFPSTDPRMTNEGFRQAVFDVRALSAFLKERGAPSVGVMGMSLGGYTTSLVATIEKDLAFAVPIIPLASIADVALQNNRFVGNDDQKRLQHAALDAAHRAVSPFARPPTVSSDRVLVVGAAGDRITPIRHAERLAAHFSAPLEVIFGGHLLQLGRGDAFRAIGRLLGRHGLFR